MDSDVKGDDFVYLGWLLRSGTSTGIVVTAIEQKGIYGSDRYGRFKSFKPKSKEVAGLLDKLAERYARLNDPQREWSPDDDDPSNDPLDRFGWPAAHCPEFATIAKATSRPPWDEPGRTSPSLLLVLGAVLRLAIKDKVSSGRSVFSSQAQLIEMILQKMEGVRGLSKRNVEGAFARANDTIEAALKERPPSHP